jgi:ribosomal protein L3 glutamine methyltransferase
MTLVELVQTQSERLKRSGVSFGHGTGNAFDEAAWLVTWALGLPLDALETRGARDVTSADIAKAETLIAQRIATRKPAAYLTGEAWLQNVPFTIDERSIVPRSYIAELLVDAEETGTLDAWLSDRTQRVLDLCCGNGSLAVIAAMAYAEIDVDASDISAAALDLARINVARHGLGSRIRVIESDLFAKLRGNYDLILCNPPYVTDASMAALPAEYRAEPALALAGGEDGMDLIRRIVADAPAHLSEDGVLVLEVGHERERFDAAFPRLECAWLATSGGDDCVVLVQRRALVALTTPIRHP